MRLLQIDTPEMHGQDVKDLQKRLLDLGLSIGNVDGVFGLQTDGAVRVFQQRNKLDVDGIVGPITRESLGLPDKCKPEIYDGGYFEPPRGRHNWEIVYGIPTGRQSWKQAYLGFCDLSDLRIPRMIGQQEINEHRLKCGLRLADYGADPLIEVKGVGRLYYPLPNGERLNYFATRRHPKTGNVGYGFVCHKLLTPVFREFFKRLVECDLMKHLKTINGAYIHRLTRSGRSLSPHAYGMAIDLDAEWNQMGYQPTMNPDVVKVGEEMGFTVIGMTWGGNFSRPDGMHFQWGSY